MVVKAIDKALNNLAELKVQAAPKTYNKGRVFELNFCRGELAKNFRKPSDMIAETNDVYRKKRATSPKKSGLFEIWRPRVDSNDRPLP